MRVAAVSIADNNDERKGEGERKRQRERERVRGRQRAEIEREGEDEWRYQPKMSRIPTLPPLFSPSAAIEVLQCATRKSKSRA
jgi:hypothetical protein